MRITNSIETRMADSASLDAFGRLRTAYPYTLFDIKQIHESEALFWEDAQVSGSGTSTAHSVAKASTTITVSASTAGKRVRRTYRRFNYQPGKSQSIIMTGQMVSQSTNLRGIKASIGLNDDDNGVFFSIEDGTAYVTVRTKVTGSVVNNKVAQSSWNLDTLDGNGPSGVRADLTKTQIFMIDFEWLGVGRVRFGFNIGGKTIYVHESLNANNLGVVYMSTPNLPLSYELENTGAGIETSMQHICSTVISEGGLDAIGLVQSISNGTTEVTATTAGTYYALLGIRIKAAHVGETVTIENVSVGITSGGVFEWQLRFNPTVASTFTYADVTGAGIQKAVGVSANVVTGGTIIAQGYGASGGTGGGAAGFTGGALSNALLLGSSIAGVMDTIVLCVTSTTNGETFLGGMTLRQLS